MIYQHSDKLCTDSHIPHVARNTPRRILHGFLSAYSYIHVQVSQTV